MNLYCTIQKLQLFLGRVINGSFYAGSAKFEILRSAARAAARIFDVLKCLDQKFETIDYRPSTINFLLSKVNTFRAATFKCECGNIVLIVVFILLCELQMRWRARGRTR